MWSLLKLKVDEAVYFFEQLRAHTRQPRLFLYYLSAFVTSARSVTFHLQKQFVKDDRTEIYEPLSKEMLSDPSCKFFIELRNQAEKHGYPTLHVQQVAERIAKDSKKSVWYSTGDCTLCDDQSNPGIDFLETLIRLEWEWTSMGGPPAHISYQWSFPNYPGGSKEVIEACEEHVRRLWRFIYEFRMEWEAANDPGASDRKIDTFFSQDERQ